MNLPRICIVLLVCAWALQGCTETPKYGTERGLAWPGTRRQIWAVAPAIDLSGQKNVDPLLQADLVFEKLQQVEGITVIPVNRVAEVYASLRIDKVQSQQQAGIVCELLGCNALVVPTITAYDPYAPPKFGASLQLFGQAGMLGGGQSNVDVRQLVRSAAPGPDQPMAQAGFVQAVGMYDAANGTVRDAILAYADGRADPNGPLGSREYFVNMDRYCGFVYHCLIRDLIGMVTQQR